MKYTAAFATVAFVLLLAGCPVPPVDPPEPAIGVSETSHVVERNEFDWAFQVWNAGDAGTDLDFSATATPAWLTLSTNQGQSTSPADPALVSVHINMEAVDDLGETGVITITAGDAQATVTLIVPPAWEQSYSRLTPYFSDDTVVDMQATTDGGAAILATAERWSTTDLLHRASALYTIKIDANGGTVWKTELYAPWDTDTTGLLIPEENATVTAVHAYRSTSFGPQPDGLRVARLRDDGVIYDAFEQWQGNLVQLSDGARTSAHGIAVASIDGFSTTSVIPIIGNQIGFSTSAFRFSPIFLTPLDDDEFFAVARDSFRLYMLRPQADWNFAFIRPNPLREVTPAEYVDPVGAHRLPEDNRLVVGKSHPNFPDNEQLGFAQVITTDNELGALSPFDGLGEGFIPESSALLEDGSFVIAGTAFDSNGAPIPYAVRGHRDGATLAEYVDTAGDLTRFRKASSMYEISIPLVAASLSAMAKGDAVYSMPFFLAGDTAAADDTKQTPPARDIVITKLDGDANVLLRTEVNVIEEEFDSTLESASAVIEFDDGYLIAGRSITLGGDSTGYLVKTDTAGTEIWTADGFGSAVDALAATTSGGALLLQTDAVGGTGQSLTRVNAQGVPESNFTIPFDLGEGRWFQVASTTEDFLLAGIRIGDSGNRGLIALRIDDMANIISVAQYPTNVAPSNVVLSLASEGGFALAAGLPVSVQESDTLFVRYGESNNLLGERLLITKSADTPVALEEGPDGSFFIAGTRRTFSEGVETDRWVYAAQLTADADLQWSRAYQSVPQSTARDAAILPDGSVVIGGSVRSLGDGVSRMLMHVSATGDELGTRIYPDSYGELTALLPLDDGTVVAAGALGVHPNLGQRDLILQHTSPSGYLMAPDK
jgi:hypothetical protein